MIHTDYSTYYESCAGEGCTLCAQNLTTPKHACGWRPRWGHVARLCSTCKGLYPTLDGAEQRYGPRCETCFPTTHSSCPKWGARGHNLLMGGRAVFRERWRPWRRYRHCTGCGAHVPANEPLPPTTDEWLAG